MNCVVLRCIVLISVIAKLRVAGFSRGAPGSVCLGHHTGHGDHKHQLSECPYKIQLGSSTYNPSDEISMTLSAPDGRAFKGFMVVAHRVTGDREKSLGTFTNYTANKAQLTYCAFDQNTVLTHSNNNETTSVQFAWKAPNTNEGDVVLKYMVVTNFETFWMDISSPILRAATPPTNIASTEQETFDFEGVDWNECGQTKGCFLYPRLCSGSDCKAAVTYQPKGDKFVIELYVSSASYISVGFSDDVMMGEDHVLACAAENGVMSVQNGRNPRTFYTRVYRTGLTDMSMRVADGKLECRLTRPSALVLYGTENGNVTFDMNKDYYLFLAWGNVYENTDVLSHHDEAPTVSETKVNFKEMIIVRGSSLHLLTQIHGILMFVAWILFVGVTTVISRHYKDGFGSKFVLGTKLWFQLHRACAVIAWCCTAAAFIIIFVHVGGLTQVAELHSYLGIALMSASTLQVMAGMLRPDPKSSIRPVFNWGHWFLGNAAHILAAVSFFMAFYSRIIPSEQRRFGVIAVSVTVGLQILWTLVFEVKKCRNASEKYTMPKEEKSVEDKKSSSEKCDVFLLVLYIITLAAMTAVCILSILLY